MDRTRSFLQAVLGFDEFLGIRALTKAEVDVDRKGFAGLLRAGFARRLVRGVYAVAPPFAFGRDPVPPPFEIAAALCRLHGRKMAVPNRIIMQALKTEAGRRGISVEDAPDQGIMPILVFPGQ